MPGKGVVAEGVTISGWLNVPGSVPVHASWMYSRNMLAFVQNLFKNGPDAPPDLADESVASTLVTRDHRIVHAGTLRTMGNEEARRLRFALSLAQPRRRSHPNGGRTVAPCNCCAFCNFRQYDCLPHLMTLV